MPLLRRILYLILIILTGFLAVSAIPGGIALMLNFYAPPVEQLAGSMFKSFLVPGLALALIVGGSGLLAALLLARRSRYGLLFANTAAVIILFFEFVEVMVIGSPTGPARAMQIIYVAVGILIAVCAMGLWFIDLRRA